jgi:methyltransferase (TIGR00027 family)
VLDDPYALPLIGAQWDELFSLTDSIFPPPVQQVVRGGLTARSRYAEDRFLQGDAAQYVVLGAGLDSFAWRRPDVLRRASVFEVDHPLTQAWKHDRVAALHLPTAEGPTFVPCDFEHENLHQVLESAGFDWATPATFSWIAVSMYLTVPAIEETLRTIAAGAVDTEIVLSYAPPRAGLDELSQAFFDIMVPLAESRGEPIQSFFEESEIEDLVRRCGLEVVDHPSHAELNERYLTGRADGLRTYMCERMLTAAVA